MEADYGDVVPRRDFERLEAQHAVSMRLFNKNRIILTVDRELFKYIWHTNACSHLSLVATNA